MREEKRQNFQKSCSQGREQATGIEKPFLDKEQRCITEPRTEQH